VGRGSSREGGWKERGKPDEQRAWRWISSMSEIPVHSRPRRCGLDQSEGARKAHSLIDKVYQRKNLEMPGRWSRPPGQWRWWTAESGRICRRNSISSWIDCTGTEGRCLPAPTGAAGTYPESGKSQESFARWESRRFTTGMPATLLNRLETDLEPVLDEANFDIGEGDRRRTPCANLEGDAEPVGSGSWIRLKDFFGRWSMRNC